MSPVLNRAARSKVQLAAEDSQRAGLSATLQSTALAVLLALLLTLMTPLFARAQAQQPTGNTFSAQEIVDSGHVFFGTMAQGMAQAIENLTARYGQPNGYILGEEASAAFFGGLRYGEGVLYTRNAGNHEIYWQGPSLGLDWGGDGTRTMVLVYNLPNIDAMYQRYPGVNGSAFFVGGLSASASQNGDVVVAPIRAGVGARLGLSVGYLKFTPQPTWNPF